MTQQEGHAWHWAGEDTALATWPRMFKGLGDQRHGAYHVGPLAINLRCQSYLWEGLLYHVPICTPSTVWDSGADVWVPKSCYSSHGFVAHVLLPKLVVSGVTARGGRSDKLIGGFRSRNPMQIPVPHTWGFKLVQVILLLSTCYQSCSQRQQFLI